MSPASLERAARLLDLGRAEDALDELGRVLSLDPSNAQAHAFRALALADLDDFGGALEAAQRATGEAPEWSFAHYVSGTVHLRASRWKDALAAAHAAVALEPEDDANHALVASAYAGMSRWRDAADAAAEGLRIAPTDERCLNLRALALRMLGELDGAEEALGTALAEDPENAWTLQNLGWARLQAGAHGEAAELFREALRLDPEDAASREGLAQAIKARAPLFRPILAWQMLCAKLSSGRGLALILGFWVLNQVIARSPLGDTPFGTAILVLYLSFAWMSWAGNSLFDVALLARRDLRPILLPREAWSAAGVGGLVLLAVVALVEAFTIGRGQWYGEAAVPTLALTAGGLAAAAIPMAGWAPLRSGKARATGLTVAAVAAGAALFAFVVAQVWAVKVAALPHEFVPGGPVETQIDTVVRLKNGVQFGATAALLVSVASSWLLTGLGFVPESRGARGRRARPGR